LVLAKYKVTQCTHTVKHSDINEADTGLTAPHTKRTIDILQINTQITGN